MDKRRYDIIVITGPTASGKTAFAAFLASEYGGAIISADSRQVYRGMDTGTGKDYEDYLVEGRMVPVHMIDIVDPGYKYNVYEYQRDFLRVYENLRQKGVLPVVCGGSGMYIDSIISGYRLVKVPLNDKLRKELGNKSLEELSAMLAGYKRLHNKTDIDTHKRAIRAIEIEEYYRHNSEAVHDFPLIRPLIFGIKYDRESRRERISRRLESRLESGMTEEVKALLDSGIPADTLIYYGLEYRYITYYLLGQMSYDEMKGKLETAIHQFAKRQMTWFRGMERKGIKIHWLDGHMSNQEKLKRVKEIMR
ncbi:MAG: tRNA (adenosine(37)-N6)-dimethylallyltransferase MiaA [Bacteroidales bacterium]